MDRVLTEKRPALAGLLGHAGIWMFYAGGLVLSFSQMGPLGSAAFLTAFAAGRVWAPVSTTSSPGDKARGISIMGAGCMALLSLEPALVLVIALSAAVGVASRMSGTPDPWITIPSTARVSAPDKGWSGPAGAMAAAILIAAAGGDPTYCLAAAALVFGASVLAGPAPSMGGSSGTGLARASVGAWACLAVMGFRVLEPGLLTEPASAVFFIPAWAFGAKGAQAWLGRLDERVVAASPFAAGAAMAALGVVTGPGLIFLYASVGALVSFRLAGEGVEVAGSTARRALGGAQILVALSGTAVGVAGLTSSFSIAVWSLGAVVIAGGFVDLASVRREETPRVAAEPQPATLLADRLPRPGGPQMVHFDLRKRLDLSPRAAPPPQGDQVVRAGDGRPPEEKLHEAASILLEAMKQARAIRRAGLTELARAKAPVPGIRQRTLSAIDEMLESLRSGVS